MEDTSSINAVTAEAPLSPVLNNSRRNLKLIAKRKSKLLSKYSQDFSESQGAKQLSNFSSQSSASPEKETTSLEDRLKRCKNVQKNKKFCYDIASSSTKFAGGNSPELNLEYSDKSVILEENMNTGFKFVSGKNVRISERSLKRATKIFEDITEDNIPLSTLSNKNLIENDNNEILSSNTQITDTQMCSAAENAECLMDFVDNWDVSPQNKENNSFVDDFEISTQESNRLFSDITQNIIGNKNTDLVTLEGIENNTDFFGFSEGDILTSLHVSAVNSECVNQIEQKIHCLKRNIKNEINLFKKPNLPLSKIIKKSPKRLINKKNSVTHTIVTRNRNKSDMQNMPSSSKSNLKIDKFATETDISVKYNRNLFEDIENINYVGQQNSVPIFSTASGKKCSISEKNVLKAKNMFKDIENLDSIDTDLDKSEEQSFFNNFFDQTKNIVHDNSFATAAVSEKILKIANNMFQDIETLQNDDLSLLSNVVSNERKNIIQPNSETFKNATFSTAAGQKCAVSEKNLKIANNMFQDIETLQKDDLSSFLDVAPDNAKIIKNATFATAAGKKCAVSEKNFKTAEKIFRDIENLENPEVFSSFSTGSGKKCAVSEKGLRRARNIFEDVERLEIKDLNENVEEIALSGLELAELVSEKKCNTPTDKLKNNKTASMSSPNLHFNSPIQSANTSTPILRQTLASKSLKKRSLGMSSSMCRQIDLSETKIKRAKLSFEDVEPLVNSHCDFSPKIDKNPLDAWVQDTVPKRDKEKQINVADTTITNEDLNNLVPSLDFKLIKNNYYCFQERNSGDYYSNFEERVDYLEKQTAVMKLRMDLFQKQQSLLKNPGTSDHKRQRRGVLFTKKQNNNPNRLSIQKYVRSHRNINSNTTNCNEKITLDSFLLEVTPKNAANFHLHVPWLLESKTTCPVIRTEDGATVIPNHLNYVGITEIQNAVLTMPGVDASLVPDNWVKNHFKWIVWKLVSMERMFPDCFKGCLSVGSIVEQLKYRYDVEIDGIHGRPQRSALKMIVQRDDVSSRRIVLCVSSIDKLLGNRHELELTDGWYGIKTTIDDPLNHLINKNLVQIGTKLIIHGAELVNCEGCCPLEIPDTARLQIHYNCTKKAAADTKLGFTHNPNPFNVSLRCVKINGGPVSLTSGYIARIYPICFMETCEGCKIWRNKKAEQLRANIWERDQGNLIERIRGEVEKNLEAEYFNKRNSKTNRTKVLLKDISTVSDVVTLFDLLEESNDPDSLKELLTHSQCRNLQEYQMKLQIDRQSELAAKIASKLSSTNMEKRTVFSVIRILLLDINSPDNYRFFSLWRPTETHLQILKEGVIVNLYNIDLRNHSNISSTSRTQFEILSNVPTAKYLHFNRTITPIEILAKPFFKANFSEFDTIGLIVQISIEAINQCIWLVNEKLEFLSIRIREGPQTCSLLDNLKEGQFVTVLNLMYHKNKKYVSAEGNLYTVFSSNPPSYYKKNYEDICAAFDKDINEYLLKCQGILELHDCETNLLNNMQIESNMSFNNNRTEITETLTASDEEMSLIDTQFY